MKQLLVAMAMLFSALTMQAQGNVHSRFIQQGIFGQATISIERGNITLQVQSGTDPNSPDGQGIATVLFYTLFQFGADGNSSTFTQVFAHIPNGSFTGQNTQRMILDVDTSQFDPNDSILSTCTATFLPVLTRRRPEQSIWISKRMACNGAGSWLLSRRLPWGRLRSGSAPTAIAVQPTSKVHSWGTQWWRSTPSWGRAAIHLGASRKTLCNRSSLIIAYDRQAAPVCELEVSPLGLE
jgi:hypothetical protein